MVHPLLSARRRPGPARKTFYPATRQPGVVNNSKEFREEFSCAFSSTFLLAPHALIRSYFDEKSIWSFRDPEALRLASLSYPALTNPEADLRYALRSVYQARILYQQQNTLHQQVKFIFYCYSLLQYKMIITNYLTKRSI